MKMGRAEFQDYAMLSSRVIYHHGTEGRRKCPMIADPAARGILEVKWPMAS